MKRTNNIKRSSLNGMQGPSLAPHPLVAGVGARHQAPPPPRWGGGYLDICINFGILIFGRRRPATHGGAA